MEHLPPKFTWSGKMRILLLILSAIGVLSFLTGLGADSERAWANYLLGYYYWMCIGLAGVFFTALQHITGARWSTVLRRVPETFIGYLPVSLLLFGVLLFGLPHLYEWAHPHVMETDAALKLKKAYLNVPFFVIRNLLLYALCYTLGWSMIKNSLKQDETGDPGLSRRNVKISALFLLIFGWAFTFVSIDLLMSLSPHWFSTIFGVYCWAGLFTSGLAMITLWVILLKRRGMLSGFVNENHLHDLGKLLFAFTVFWAYIAFSQFMLIWYANLPEETFYMIARTTPSWKPVSIALMLGKFFIPFFMLLSHLPKRREGWLLFAGFWFLAAQWLDLYWLIFPTFYKEPVFGWMEIGVFAGFSGLFLLSTGSALRRVNPVPVKDPSLEASLHHHQS